MKLITCYVENFGKLNKFTYDFKPGLNTIEEENGWGKTTFSAFIKAMFYGLEYHRGKKLTDRKLYMPWNGNKFGGFIVFEKDGNQYKIERFFGKRDKEDTLKVYDMTKNIVTKDFGENPGEEIWKVDRDSYEKTAFISLSDSSLLNDIISSKLGDIEDQEADLETSSKAVDLLDKKILKIKAKRGKSGLLDEKIETIAKLNRDLREYNNSLSKIEENEGWIRSEEENFKDITKRIWKNEEEQAKISLYDKKRHYIDLKNDFRLKKDEWDKNKCFFKDKSLTEEELNILKDEAGQYINQIKEVNKISLSDDEKRELERLQYKFKDSQPGLSEIEDYNDKISLFHRKQVEIENYRMTDEDEANFIKLDKSYRDIDPDPSRIEGYLSDLNEIKKLDIEENNINMEILKLDHLQESRNMKKEKNKMSPLLLLASLLTIVGVLSIANSLIIGSILAICGITILLYCFLHKSKASQVKSPANDEKIEVLKDRLKNIHEKKITLKSGYLSFLKILNEEPENLTLFLANSKEDIGEYRRLKKEKLENLRHTEKLINEISGLKTEIERFLLIYYDLSLNTSYEKMLSNLRTSLYSFQELSKSDSLYKDSKENNKRLKNLLKEKFKYYYQEFPEDLSFAVNDLTNRYYSLQACENKFEEAKENLKNFERGNDISILNQISLANNENNKLLEDLRVQKKDFEEEKNNIIKKVERYKKDIDDLSQDADKIEDVESSITKLQIEVEELQEKYELTSIAKTCMIQAKENLASKYIGEMTLNFEKYLNLLDTDKADQYQIDINLDVKVHHQGELYDSNQLSRGMKDLIQVCMRMSLIEAVYKDAEKPILILDDPFVNLDNNRLKNAIKLLNKISLDYQMIYFICHTSRNVA